MGGRIRSADEVAGNLRAGFPRFEPGNLEHNVGRVAGLARHRRLGLTTGQLALAWLPDADIQE